MKSNQDNYIRELNTNHVMFFKEFAGEDKKKVIIIDATRGTGKVSVRCCRPVKDGWQQLHVIISL